MLWTQPASRPTLSRRSTIAGMEAGPGVGLGGRKARGRKREHGGQRGEGRDAAEQGSEREGQRGEAGGEPEAPGLGNDAGNQQADRTIDRRPAEILLDMHPRVIDQVHIVDAGRAGRHAAQAGQAAVEMLDDIGGDWSAALQHALDEIDATARANRARRRAEHRSGMWPCRNRNGRICG